MGFHNTESAYEKITFALALICICCTATSQASRSCRDLTPSDAPINGALVCHGNGEYKYCAVRCNIGYQTTMTPKFYEFCGPTTGFRWTFENDDSNTRINSCTSTTFPEARIWDDLFYLSGSCDDLTDGQKDAVVQGFYARILSRMPGILISPTYNGELLCYSPAAPVTTQTPVVPDTCRNLTAADAPENGALVCYDRHNMHVCSARCNAGYEFVSHQNSAEMCGAKTGSIWTFRMSDNNNIQPCIEQFFPGVMFETDDMYLPVACHELTTDMETKVKEDFKSIAEETSEDDDISLDDIRIACGRQT